MKKKVKRGFTLVELMIVVAIVGVLAALAIYGVRKYVLNAKTAEARNSIGQMAKDASTAYNREGMDSAVLTLGQSTGIVNRLCGQAAAAVPANATTIQGKKYQSSPADWSATSQEVGWACLKFSMQDPQYFQYNYTSSGTNGATNDTFNAIARGDLDGDTDLSTFSISGRIQEVSGEKVVTIAPNLDEIDPEE